jgi:hypothetical protein
VQLAFGHAAQPPLFVAHSFLSTQLVPFHRYPVGQVHV